MSMINGCGTMHYDWLHLPDATAHATKWVVLFFFPIIPLRREHLQVLEARALGGTHVVRGTVPMELIGIVRTYAKAYLLIPIVFLVPAAIYVVIVFVVFWFFDLHESRGVALAAVMALGCLVYWGVALSLILERSFGRK